MNDLDGITLYGDITKDEIVILANNKAEFFYNEEYSTLGRTAFEFHLSLAEKPELALGDNCKLVTEAITLDIQVIHFEFPLEQLCFITFVTR